MNPIDTYDIENLTKTLKAFLYNSPETRNNPAEMDRIRKGLDEIKHDIQQVVMVDPYLAILDYFQVVDEQLDSLIEAHKKQLTCKKGCSHCCHMDVAVTKPEIAVIVRWCEEHQLPIDKAYLRRQVQYSMDDLPESPVSACVFLKDHLCSIYPVRPLACRRYLVSSDVRLCEQHSDTGIIQMMSGVAEILICGYYLALKSGYRLTEGLLLFAK